MTNFALENTSASEVSSDILNQEILNKLGLSEHDLDRVQEMAKNTNVDMLVLSNLGQNNMTQKYVDDVLQKAQSEDLGEAGKKMSEIAVIAQSVNVNAFSNKRSKLPIIGPLIDKLTRKGNQLQVQFSNANTQINTILDEVSTIQQTLVQRNNELDSMFNAVTSEYKDLGMNIAAAMLKKEELKAEIQAKEQVYIKSGQNNPLLSQEISDLNFKLQSLDKRIGDLSVMQHASQQLMPAIRIIQSNNRLLSDKFSTVREVTIPAWKNQFMLALTLAEQQNHVEMADLVDNATNDLLKSNANLLHKNAVGASIASQRLAINPATLQEVHNTLLKTVDDVIKTQEQGERERQVALGQLEKLNIQQNQKLLRQ